MNKNQSTGLELNAVVDEQSALEKNAHTTEMNAVTPSAYPGSIRKVESKTQKVFALGILDIDFENDSIKDSYSQLFDGDINRGKFLKHFKKNPQDSEDIIWVLKSITNEVPIYALKAAGIYAGIGQQRLMAFIEKAENQEVEMVAIPGIIQGGAKLLSGLQVPIIHPSIRGMVGWSTRTLINEFLEKKPDDKKGKEEYLHKADRIEQFLAKVYYEFRNMGLTPQERAINYTASNLFQTKTIFENTIKEGLELSTVQVQPCPISLPGREMMDVQLTYFNPLKRMGQAQKVYIFTVDVTEVVPVTIGKVRSWYKY